MKRSGKKQFDNWEWMQLKKRYKFRCLRCSQKEDPTKPETLLTADHVIPLWMGGARNISNIQPLCKPCNQAKDGDVTDYRWRKFKN